MPRASAREDGPARPRLAPLLRLLALLRPYKLRFALAALTLIATSAIALVYPQVARYAIDLGVSGGSARLLDRVMLGLIAVFTLHGLLVWARHYLTIWLGERAVADLRVHTFDRLLALPPSWFHDRRSGELVGRLASDVAVIETMFGGELGMALRHALQLAGGIAMLVLIDVRLTIAMLVVIPVIAIGSTLLGRAIRGASRAVQDELAEVSARAHESFAAIETVQAFRREAHEATRYRGNVESAFARALSLGRRRASLTAGVSVAAYVALALILWLGGRAVVRGQLSPGDLAAFMLYTVAIAASLANLATVWGAVQRAAGATERLFDIIDTTPAIRDPESPRELPAGRGRIALDQVAFHYGARPDVPVLSGVDLDVAPGEVVALVGPSGAGKSTLAALLLRFYDPVAGAIRLDGADLRALRLRDLRAEVATVAQEAVLLSGTIRDNIGYGRAGATDLEIAAAARDAHAHEFIARLPGGYDTEIGERGIKLSGGQRQRIAIARAVLANPRVLILDEATSNLDVESEAIVREALTRLMRGRTTLIIAHRLSAVRDADRIAVISGGRIVELGSHDELMSAGGAYRRMIEQQDLGARPARPASAAASV